MLKKFRRRSMKLFSLGKTLSSSSFIEHFTLSVITTALELLLVLSIPPFLHIRILKLSCARPTNKRAKNSNLVH